MKEKIKAYLNSILEDEKDNVPDAALDFWIQNYGKEVQITINEPNGTEWFMDKVLTVDEEEDGALYSGPMSWRDGGGSPEFTDYSVYYLEGLFPNWEDHDKLIPVAGFNALTSTAYDLLVFNFLAGHQPKVSIWVHERSFGYEEPFLIDISDDAAAFFKNLNH